MNRFVGVFQVLAAGTGFGFLGIFGKWAFSEGLSVGEFLFWRFLFAATFLWILLLLFKPQLVRLPARQILTSGLLGFFGYAVFSTLYFESIKGISVALAAMLLFTFPIFVSLGSHFILKDRMTTSQWWSLLGAFTGMTILLWGEVVVESITAVLAGLFASITYAIYVLVSGKVQKKVEPLSSSLYVITAAAIALCLFHQPRLSRVLEFTTFQYLLILGISIVCSIIPLTLFLAGLQKMKSSQASILVMIEPVVAAIAAWVLLHERLSLLQIVGALLILGSIALNALSGRTKVQFHDETL